MLVTDEAVRHLSDTQRCAGWHLLRQPGEQRVRRRRQPAQRPGQRAHPEPLDDCPLRRQQNLFLPRRCVQQRDGKRGA